MKKKLYYYDYIYIYLNKLFIKDIALNILNIIYPKIYLNLNMLEEFNFYNKKMKLYQHITLYDNIIQQNCFMCGHIEIIVLTKLNNKFKIILLHSKYKCKCNYN